MVEAMEGYEVSAIKYAELNDFVMFLCEIRRPGHEMEQRVVLAGGDKAEDENLYDQALENWGKLIEDPEKALKEIFTETIEAEYEEK